MKSGAPGVAEVVGVIEEPSLLVANLLGKVLLPLQTTALDLLARGRNTTVGVCAAWHGENLRRVGGVLHRFGSLGNVPLVR